jgi:hypothetical protein
MLWTKNRLQRWIFGSDEEAMKLEEEIEAEIQDEEFDCPIHGKLGGIDECPKC